MNANGVVVLCSDVAAPSFAAELSKGEKGWRLCVFENAPHEFVPAHAAAIF
jgi:hypothetical protein